MVAVFAPVVCAVKGLNCTVTTQVAPGANVVVAMSWPLPVGPQVDRARATLNSLALVPASTPCAMPVSGTVPVLVSVNTWAGSSAQAAIWARVVPGQLRVSAPKLRVVGVRVASAPPPPPAVSPNSTAPLSKAPTGLVLPKKSVVGAGTPEAAAVPVLTVAAVPDAGT